MTDTRELHWDVVVDVSEDDDHCEVTAHLTTKDRSFAGRGRSRRNHADPDVPQVGEQLAVARALRELAVHLTDDARHMIEQFEASR
jgi:hypothetical protein